MKLFLDLHPIPSHHSQCQWSNRTGAKTKKPELLILSLVTNYKKISSQNNSHISLLILLYLCPSENISFKPMSQRLSWWCQGGEFKVTTEILTYRVYLSAKASKSAWNREGINEWQSVWFLHRPLNLTSVPGPLSKGQQLDLTSDLSKCWQSGFWLDETDPTGHCLRKLRTVLAEKCLT